MRQCIIWTHNFVLVTGIAWEMTQFHIPQRNENLKKIEKLQTEMKQFI